MFVRTFTKSVGEHMIITSLDVESQFTPVITAIWFGVKKCHTVCIFFYQFTLISIFAWFLILSGATGKVWHKVLNLYCDQDRIECFPCL